MKYKRTKALLLVTVLLTGVLLHAKQKETTESFVGTTRLLRVRVTENEKSVVDIRVPLVLAQVALEFIPQDKLTIDGKPVDVKNLLSSINEKMEGKILDIDATQKDKHSTVSITIE